MVNKHQFILHPKHFMEMEYNVRSFCSEVEDQWLFLIDQEWHFHIREMVKEWNGFLVHYSEYEPKQPQLDPRFHGGDPQALRNARPQPASVTSLIMLSNNPFETIKYGGSTFVNVYSIDNQRSTE